MKRFTQRAVLFTFLSGLAMVAAATSPQDAEAIAELANAGNNGAQLMIALFYLNGIAGYRRSLRLAVCWARRAASSGNAYARVLADHLRGNLLGRRGNALRRV